VSGVDREKEIRSDESMSTHGTAPGAAGQADTSTEAVWQRPTGLRTTKPKGVTKALLAAHRFCVRHRSGLRLFGVGALSFLAGVAQNGLADDSNATILEVVFDVSGNPWRMLNWLLMICGTLAVLAPPLLRSWRRRQRYDFVIVDLLGRLRAGAGSPINAIAVDRCVVLQRCPDMAEGWKTSDITLNDDTIMYSMPESLSHRYEEYVTTEFVPRFGERDNSTVMLRKVPVAFTDRPGLTLETGRNRYSYSTFFWHRILGDADVHSRFQRDLLERQVIQVPHNLCLHLVVVTSDQRALLTRRAFKTEVSAGKWSCSIEENLSLGDLGSGTDDPMAAWVARALHEELALERGRHFSTENVRFLAVFAEGEKLNISMAALARVDLSSDELREYIATMPKKDEEFDRIDFLSTAEMLSELHRPIRQQVYHASSRLRMLLALLHLVGETRLITKLEALIEGSELLTTR